MVPRKLLIAAWVGGLITLGGVAAMVVLVLTSPRFPDDYDALPLWGAVIALILIMFAIGWVYGVQLGTAGVPFVAFFFAAFCLLALIKIRHLDSGLMGSAVLVGPFVLGWSLGCLWVLRRQDAAGPA